MPSEITETRKDFDCPKCEKTFSATALFIGAREMFPVRVCEPCQVAARDEQTRQAAASNATALTAGWDEICPPVYRDTDLQKLHKSLLSALEAWSAVIGLGMVGKAGTGKTRAAFEALRRQHMRGKRCAAINGTELRRLLVDMNDRNDSSKAEAKIRFKELRTCDFLLIDDLGKQKFTESAQEDLFDLLETRVSHRRPVIWTTNSNSTELGKRLSGDRGNAIIRRLVEFSEIVKIEDNQMELISADR